MIFPHLMTFQNKLNLSNTINLKTIVHKTTQKLILDTYKINKNKNNKLKKQRKKCKK